MKSMLIQPALGLALLSAALAASAQTTAFTYQGQFTVSGSPATGLYDLIFKVFDSAGPGAAGQQGGTVTLTAVPVTNGLFTVSLDFGSAPFTGARRWLQIDARTNNLELSYVTLLPRAELTPTPYALYAAKAGTVTNGAIQASQLGTVGAPSSGQVLRYNGSSLEWQTPGGGAWAVSGNNVYYNAGSVGIGTANPAAKVHVAGAQEGLRIDGPSSGVDNLAYLSFRGSDGIEIGYVGDTRPADNDVLLGATAGSVSLATSVGRVLTATAAGNVGIGTAFPSDLLTVGSSSVRGTLHVVGSSTDIPAISLTDSRTNGHQYTFYNGLSGPGSFDIRDWTAVATRLTIDSGGNVGIGTSNPGYTLDVNGSLNANSATITGVNPTLTFFDPFRELFQLKQEGSSELGASSFSIIENANGPRYLMTVRWNGNVGIGTTDPQAKLHVAGGALIDGTLTTCVLTITGGCDLAEPFNVSDNAIPKGAVMVIDEDKPGHLKMSDRAYDDRVAGIISGANGVNPGIVLKQEGTIEGTQNVALTGRVYALADASVSPIKPGDLLTTSATPGHAMKASDSSKSHGAILGKAMTGLKAGKGHVLVLVSLQ